MLGFSPIGSRAISGSPFGLVAVPALMAAGIAVAFTITARGGLYTPMSANARIAFALSGSWITHQRVLATVSFGFDGSPLLRVAGKPIVLSALPQSYTLRAMPSEYAVKAMSQSFALKGVR